MYDQIYCISACECLNCQPTTYSPRPISDNSFTLTKRIDLFVLVVI